MAVITIPLGFDWEPTAGPNSLSNTPQTADQWGDPADPFTGPPRGTISNWTNSTGWTENAGLDDPLAATSDGSNVVRSGWAKLTGVPTTLPVGTISVELRLSAETTPVSGIGPARVQFMVIRSDDVDWFGVLQHWGIQRRFWNSPGEGAVIFPTAGGGDPDGGPAFNSAGMDTFDHTASLDFSSWAGVELWFMIATKTAIDIVEVPDQTCTKVANGLVEMIITTETSPECSCEMVITDLGAVEDYGVDYPGLWWVTRLDQWCGDTTMTFTGGFDYKLIGDSASPPAVPSSGWTTVDFPADPFTLPLGGGDAVWAWQLPRPGGQGVMWRWEALVNGCATHTIYIYGFADGSVVDGAVSVDGGVTWVSLTTGEVI